MRKELYFIFAFFVGFHALPLANAQTIEDRVIPLDAGAWTHSQTTTVRGVELPVARLSGTECLEEEDANLTVGDYMDKLMKGLGEETDCEITDLQGRAGNVTFTATCTAEGAPFTSTLDFDYNYTSESVTVLAEGWAKGPTTFPIRKRQPLLKSSLLI